MNVYTLVLFVYLFNFERRYTNYFGTFVVMIVFYCIYIFFPQ